MVDEVQSFSSQIYILQIGDRRTSVRQNFYYYTKEKAEEAEREIWIKIRDNCEIIKEGYRAESEFLINYVDPIINLQTRIIKKDSNQDLDGQVDMNKYIEDRNRPSHHHNGIAAGAYTTTLGNNCIAIGTNSQI